MSFFVFSLLFLLTGPAFALWLLPPVVNLGFGRSWKNWSRTVVLLLCAGAILVDLLVYGQVWGPPLGAVIYAVTVYTFAHLGLSFVLATVLATPGCEMRAIPDLIGRLTGRTAQEHHCPGFITPLDNWEARLHQAGQLWLLGLRLFTSRVGNYLTFWSSRTSARMAAHLADKSCNSRLASKSLNPPDRVPRCRG